MTKTGHWVSPCSTLFISPRHIVKKGEGKKRDGGQKLPDQISQKVVDGLRIVPITKPDCP